MCPHDRDHAVALESEHSGDVGPEQCLDLSGERVEQRSRLDSIGDQRRHAPQRRLLLGELSEGLSRLCVRDCCGDQLGELADPLLDVGRQRLALARHRDHRPPEPRFDDDRGGDG